MRPLVLVALTLVGAAVTAVTACADGALPPRTADDPANADAAETPFVPRPPTSTSSVSGPNVATATSARPGTVYACPMGHGAWPQPGSCPVCGMTLVPRAAPSSSSSSAPTTPNMPGMSM